MNDKRITYPQPMLPHVNYALFNDNDDGLEDDFETLFELEFEAFDNYRQFLKELERVLLDATMIQIPELVVAHLCGYLGSVLAVYKGNQSKQLEPDIIKLLKQHADLAYEKFGQYTLSSSASESQRKSNLNALREDSPGSIAHQTLRLGRIIRDMIRRLSENRDDKLGFTPRSTRPEPVLVIY